MGKVGLEPTVFLRHGFTVRCNRHYAYLHLIENVVFLDIYMRGGVSRSAKSETRNCARALGAGVIEENRTLIFRATI